MSEPFIAGGIIATDEHGKRHGPFMTPVVEELRRMGILWQDAQGVYRIQRQHVGIVSLNPHIAVCDFCGLKPVVWDCDVETFDHDVPQSTMPYWTSVGGYFACDPCGALIVEGKRQALADRATEMALTRMADRLPDLPRGASAARALRAAIDDIHRKFWRHFKSIQPIERATPALQVPGEQ